MRAAALAGGDLGLYALMATSFFMSIQFPTIFTMSLRGLGTYTKSGSSFLVMAIVGGAVIPPLMGLVSDASTINLAMLIPALCFAVVLAVRLGVTPRRGARRGRDGRCMTAALARRELGATGLAVTTLGFGGAGIGNLYRELADADALAAVQESFASGVRYFDTAPFYGFGLSEQRLGQALAGSHRRR